MNLKRFKQVILEKKKNLTLNAHELFQCFLPQRENFNLGHSIPPLVKETKEVCAREGEWRKSLQQSCKLRVRSLKVKKYRGDSPFSVLWKHCTNAWSAVVRNDGSFDRRRLRKVEEKKNPQTNGITPCVTIYRVIARECDNGQEEREREKKKEQRGCDWMRI